MLCGTPSYKGIRSVLGQYVMARQYLQLQGRLQAAFKVAGLLVYHLQLVFNGGAPKQDEIPLYQLGHLSHLGIPVLEARLGFKIFLLPSKSTEESGKDQAVTKQVIACNV